MPPGLRSLADRLNELAIAHGSLLQEFGRYVANGPPIELDEVFGLAKRKLKERRRGPRTSEERQSEVRCFFVVGLHPRQNRLSKISALGALSRQQRHDVFFY